MATRLSIDVDIHVDQRDDGWAATVYPFGFTVYGDTEDAVIQRAEVALKFLLKNYANGARDPLQKVRGFLDARGAKHNAYQDHSYSVRRDMKVLVNAT